MKLAPMLVIAALVAPLCRADESQSVAEKILDLSGTRANMQQTFEAGLKPSLDQFQAKGAPPALVEAIHEEARSYFAENFKWEEMRPQLAKIYADTFTEAELRDLLAFYKTSTGQKMMTQLPALTQKSMMVSMAGVQANMAEFQRRVGALIQEYQNKPGQQAPAAITVPAAAK